MARGWPILEDIDAAVNRFATVGGDLYLPPQGYAE